MRIRSKTASLIAPCLLALAASPAYGAFTFLQHFNSSSSFDINPANGEFAGGDATATVVGSPTTATGYFPGSSPANLAYRQTGGGSYIEFNGADGNINFTSPTQGGITVGAWVKMTGTSTPNARIVTLGEPDQGDDCFVIDFGNAHDNTPRVIVRDGGTFSIVETSSTITNTAINNWVYFAATADLTNSQLSLYAYNSSGAIIGGGAATAPLTLDNGWNLNNPLATFGRVRVGHSIGVGPSTSLFVDELSIDDTVLTQSEIAARVASMVAGNQLTLGGGGGNSNWANASGGDWHVAANWSNATVPNGVGAEAVLGSGISAPRTVFADTAITLGTLTFNNANLYNLSGAASLSMQVATGQAAINVQAGSHKINLPLTFVSDTAVDVSANATLTISNPVTIQASKTVTRTGTGAMLIQAPLTIEAGGTLLTGSVPLSVFGAPSLATGARINIGTSTLNVDYRGQSTPASAIESQLTSAYAGGAWTGEGIMTSSSTASRGLGWVDDSGSQSVKVKFTYYGDTNLSGTVDSTDFNALLAGYGKVSDSTWAQGDFNYDDKVNTLDFNLLTGNFGASPIPSAVLGAVVPEPTTAVLVVVGLLAVGRSRRCL